MSGRGSIDTPSRELIISGLTFLPDVLCDKCTEYIVSESFAPNSPIIECIKSGAIINIPKNAVCSTFLQRHSVGHAPRPETAGHMGCVMVEGACSFVVRGTEEGTVQNSGIPATRERPVGLRSKILEAEIRKIPSTVPAYNIRKRHVHAVRGQRVFDSREPLHERIIARSMATLISQHRTGPPCKLIGKTSRQGSLEAGPAVPEIRGCAIRVGPPIRVLLKTGPALSANITETPATFGISVGRWR